MAVAASARRVWRALLVLAACSGGAACSVLFDVSDIAGGGPATPDGDGIGNGGDAADASLLDGSDPATYRLTVLADEPVGYYRLGEPSAAGTARDESGNESHGSYFQAQSSPGALEPADHDEAMTLTGNGWVDLGSRFDFDGTKPYTLECWIKPTVIDSVFRHVMTKQDRTVVATKRGPALYVRENAVSFERWVGGKGGSTSAQLLVDVWSHIAAVYDGARLRLFVNGLEMAAPHADTRSVEKHSEPFVIGASRLGGDAHFMGSIDEVAIYDRALPSDRIKAHYDSRQ